MLSRLILVAILAVDLLAQGTARGTSRSPAPPASLSNQEFWNIVTEFSEVGGVFPYDNYTSNELVIGQPRAGNCTRAENNGGIRDCC
jgi:hypothetical protein